MQHAFLTSWSKKIKASIRAVTKNRVFLGMLLLLTCYTFGVIIIDLIKRFVLEVQGPEQWDESIYWAVGRGILNGLAPYTDLYDIKPPGIYLIAATSLWITDGRVLGDILQALAIVGITISSTTFVFGLTRQIHNLSSALLITNTFNFFGVLALFSAKYAGEFQTESFGAFFGTVFVLAIAGKPPLSKRRIVFAGICLLGATGMKEPFLLITIAAALLYATSFKQLARSLLYPFLIASSLGCFVLALCGWLAPYVSVYLYEMLFKRIHTGGNLWLNGFDWHNLLHFAKFYYSFNGPVFILLCIFLLCTILITTWGAKRISMYNFLLMFIIKLIACYLVMVATLSGGSWVYEHHFVLSIPAFAALYIICTRSVLLSHSTCTVSLFSMLTTCFLFAGTMHFPYTKDIQANIRGSREWEKKGRSAAQQIDSLLDACELDRYQFIGMHGPMPYGYTQHSPMGPLFHQYRYFFSQDRTYFRSAIFEQLEQAQIVVMSEYRTDFNDLKERVYSYLEQHFTERAWPCAAQFADIPSYVLLFRKTDDLTVQNQL